MFVSSQGNADPPRTIEEDPYWTPTSKEVTDIPIRMTTKTPIQRQLRRALHPAHPPPAPADFRFYRRSSARCRSARGPEPGIRRFEDAANWTQWLRRASTAR
ncbi:MAG: hypothetical protein R3F11_20170 [Verrucomicrobiales bacterium]